MFITFIHLSPFRIRRAMKVQMQLTQRTQTQEEQRRELNMAIVLIWIVVLFIACQSVKIIPDIYEALHCYHYEVVYHNKQQCTLQTKHLV